MTDPSGVAPAVAVLCPFFLVGFVTVARANIQYFLGQTAAKENYYTQGGEPQGYWIGKGAEAIGLSGTADDATLKNLALGFSPDGAKSLVQPQKYSRGDKRSSHQEGWDMPCSPPKSCSIFWAKSPEETRKVVQDCHRDAVARTFQFLEENACWTRRGKGGKTLEETSPVAVVFEHGTSRNLDPQLHSHIVIFNVGVRKDQTTGTVLSHPLYTHQKAAGALYRAELAKNLTERLGLQIRRGESSFEIYGIPKDVIEEFSSRRKEILAEAERVGFASHKARDFATLKTRSKKEHAPRALLFPMWGELLEKKGCTTELIHSLLNRAGLMNHDKALDKAVLEAADRLAVQNSFFPVRNLVAETALSTEHLAVSADKIQAALNQALKSEATQIITLGQDRTDLQLTTKENLAEEEKLIASVENLKSQKTHWAFDEVVDDVLSRRKYRMFNEGQKAGLKHITQGTGAIRVLTGKAGTGKSTLLSAANDVWRQQGYRVFGACVSGRAAQNLEKASGIESTSIAKWCYELDLRGWGGVKHAAREIGKEALRATGIPFHLPQRSGPDRHFRLTKDSILVIDESSMAETKQMAKLIRHAEEVGACVILTGDARQIQAIGPGGSFTHIERTVGSFELTDDVRQKNPEDARIANLIADGRSAEALRRIVDGGKLFVRRGEEQAAEKLVTDWVREGGVRAPARHQVICSTNAQSDFLNERCQRERLKESWNPISLSLTLPNQQRLFGGDRVITIARHKTLGFENGELATVTFVNPVTKTVTIKTDDGKRIALQGKALSCVQLGYAATTHRLQGSTVQHGYVLAGGSMTDRELSYVQATRAEFGTKLYTSATEAGKELTLRSKLLELQSQRRKAPQQVERVERELKATEKSKEHRIESSPLAASMNRSRQKTLAKDKRRFIQDEARRAAEQAERDALWRQARERQQQTQKR